MAEYKMLPKDATLSREELIALYNDAVEAIWQLQHECSKLDDNYDFLFENYEKIADQLYG
jgi:hypothetical protein